MKMIAGAVVMVSSALFLLVSVSTRDEFRDLDDWGFFIGTILLLVGLLLLVWGLFEDVRSREQEEADWENDER